MRIIDKKKTKNRRKRTSARSWSDAIGETGEIRKTVTTGDTGLTGLTGLTGFKT